MDMPYLHVLAALLLSQLFFASGIIDEKCTHGKLNQVFGANCADLGLESVPTDLRSDIEYLTLFHNRVRKLPRSTMGLYPSLKYLYLGENFITKIYPDSFLDLDDLELLDLSGNSLLSLTTELPASLRMLYLARNEDLTNVSLTTAFYLEFLSLASCQLRQIPSMGVLPNLKDLNVSGNPLVSVSPGDLAPLCRLERLHLPRTIFSDANPQSQCQCHRLLTWTTQHYINLPDFKCKPLEGDPEAAGCNVDFSEEVRVHKACMLASPAATGRYLLLAALAGSLLLAALVVACWWRKGRRKKNSVQDQKRIENEEKNTKVGETLIT